MDNNTLGIFIALSILGIGGLLYWKARKKEGEKTNNRGGSGDLLVRDNNKIE